MQPCIGPEPIVVEDPGGVSALEAFDAKDSRGKDMPCREGDLLRRVLRAKGSLNLQIKQWAEGVSEGLFLIDEFVDDFPWLPDWVWNAVFNQAKKRHSVKAPGWMPTHAERPPTPCSPIVARLFFFLHPFLFIWRWTWRKLRAGSPWI